jgi:hypothetical protein
MSDSVSGIVLETLHLMYTRSFATCALGKMRKLETALRFVIVKKIKSGLKGIREKTKANQSETGALKVCVVLLRY